MDDDLFEFPNNTRTPGIFRCATVAQEERRRVQHSPLLARGRTINRSESQLVVCRLWNSATPLYSDKLYGNGGGYFLIWRNKGIVVDPGYDFISTFGASRSIDDIDVVIVTHDHPDHSEDLASIVTLLREANEARTDPHHILFFLSYGTFFKYQSVFQNEEIAQYTTVEKILAPSTRELTDCNASVIFVPTKHREILGDNTGFGIVLSLRDNAGHVCRVGITGDSGFQDSLVGAFDGTDLLVAHIGTLEPLEDRILLKSHLGFRGLLQLIRKMNRRPLVLVSEWGEELCGMRKAICEALLECVPGVPVLPTDLLMRVRLPECDIYLEEENAYAPFRECYVHEDFGSRLAYKRR